MKYISNLACLLLALLLAGCFNLGIDTFTVTSNPSGGQIQVETLRYMSRNPKASFRPWGDRRTPHLLTALVGADHLRVRWSDGEVSPWRAVLGGLEEMHFEKSDVQRRVAAKPVQRTARIEDAEICLPPRTWELVNIAVADLTAYTLSKDEAKTLSEIVLSALVDTDYFNVLSRSEMRSVFEAQQFQRSGVCDDTQCLVEIGKILAVQKIVGGSIGKLGNTFSLLLKFVDVETGKTEYIAQKQLKAETDELLGLVFDASRELAFKYAESKKRR